MNIAVNHLELSSATLEAIMGSLGLLGAILGHLGRSDSSQGAPSDASGWG